MNAKIDDHTISLHLLPTTSLGNVDHFNFGVSQQANIRVSQNANLGVSFQANLGVILTIYQTMTMIMMQPPLIQLSQHELSFSRRESCNSRLIYDEKYVNLESSRITFLRISREIHVSRHSSPKFEKCNSRIKPPFSHSRLI